MGNVPISCCRSKSPRLNRNSSSRSNSGSYNKNENNQYSSNNHQNKIGKYPDRQLARHGEEYEPSHILQHISEREPDDSDTDPSSNPFNRPIFATRSSNSKNKLTCNNNNNYYDSYSSNNSTTRRQINTPLTSSQDHGYNSATTSTNLTHLDGLQLNDSFESSIQKQQQQNLLSNENNYINNNQDGLKKIIDINNVTNDNTNNYKIGDNRLLPLNSINGIDHNDDLFNNNSSLNINSLTNQKFDSTRYFSSNIIKASSCSTIYIDESTISQPDLTQTIKCVSLAIYYHIKNRTSDTSVEIFDESIHPLKMPMPPVDATTSKFETTSAKQDDVDELIILETNDEYNDSKRLILDEPDQKTIYNFVETLFKAAQLTSEYAITTLVYLERLMTYAEMDLSPKTWRRMFLGAILLSSKVWEDQAVWNVDYAQILEEISVEDINELERQFLELIQFNMNVPSSVYAKYYFHLRTLAFKNGLNKELKPMTVGEARTLEAMSRINNDDWQSSPIHRKTSSPKLKRHTSFETSRLNRLARAVLM